MGSSENPAHGRKWVGRPLPRFEDLRLVRGAGQYSDDISHPNQAYAVFLRSPHAHARIGNIDAARAKAMPGVLAVLTHVDYQAAGLASLPTMPVPAGALDVDDPVFKPTPETPILVTPQWPLAMDRVRFPGEPVAMVVAETVAQAHDAAEAVEVTYDVLPAVTSASSALAEGAPVLWPQAPDNVAFDNTFGDAQAVEAVLAQAHLVVEQTYENPRISSAFMEPRGGIASYDRASGRYTLTTGCQGAHRVRMGVCGALKEKPENIRVVCPDTGGGFGSRNDPYPEQVCILWAAKLIGRPVKWTNDRTESLLSDYQGRDIQSRTRLGFDKEGRITALAVDVLGNVGAQTLSFVQLHNTWRVAPSCYRVPVAALRLRGIVTNTVPTGPFRGAGRPEAMLAMERSLDIAARKLGLDRLDIRRRNLLTRKDLPYLSATGLTYDSGDFTGNMRKALDAADWKGFEKRRRSAAKAGRLAGIGIANYVECPVGAPHERVDLRVLPDDVVELVIGTQSTGQGHETSFAQVVADMMGVTPEQVRMITGDTDKVVSGGGSHSDRSMRLGSAMMAEASTKVLAQARKIAAHLLNADEAAITFDDGLFATPGSNRRLSIFDIARNARDNASLPQALREKLTATASMRGRIPAYPTGAAVCEVEIDPETGVVELTRYTAFDDVGQPVNPLILHGQVHGGIAQGVGQVLTENYVYDDDGQVLTASFQDYGMPRADMLPSYDVHLVEDPTRSNPLRIKGGGEGGTTPAPAVMMNAICDALSTHGIEHFDMPATPLRVWRALQQT